MVGSLRASGAAHAGGVCNGDEKQAGRLWDNFGNYERSSEREMQYVSWCRSSSLTRQWHVFVARRKACILWKLEGDLGVSKREILSGFEWWDTTGTPRARRKTFSIVSIAAHERRARVREYGMRLKRINSVFVTFGAFEACNAYEHVLAAARTPTFDPAAQKGRPSTSSLG